MTPNPSSAGCTIQLVSWSDFKKKREENGLGDYIPNGHFVGAPYLADFSVRRKDKGFTEGALECSAGGVYNTNHQVTLFHNDPELSFMPPHGAEAKTNGQRVRHLEKRTMLEKARIRAVLSEDIAELGTNGGKPVRAFLSGGQVYDLPKNANNGINPYLGGNSKKLHCLLLDILKENGVTDISQLWGRKSEKVHGPTNLFYNGPENTWYVNARTENGDVLTWKDVKKTFNTIHLAPGDELIVKDKKLEKNLKIKAVKWLPLSGLSCRKLTALPDWYRS